MALEQRIESVKKRHADIDFLVHEEEIRPAPDIVKIHELKRTKLHLKDEIEQLMRLMNGQVEAA